MLTLRELLRLITKDFLNLYKTLRFNLKYLPFQQAVLLPFRISRNVEFKCLRGNVCITGKIKHRMIEIGFGNVGLFAKNTKTVWEVLGNVTFNGTSSIGKGSKIVCGNDGDLYLGDNFNVMANSSIVCYKKITFATNCLISWDVLIMDTDFHKILQNNSHINPDEEINIGSNNWIGCNTMILKGTRTGNMTIIGSNSLVNGKFEDENILLVGSPATIAKRGVEWN